METGVSARGRVIVFQCDDGEVEPFRSMHWSERDFSRRDLRRIAAKIHPVLVKITPIATITVTTATKAVTVGKAAAMADALLPRMNVHFAFAASGRAPIGQHHETFLEMFMELAIPSRVKEAIA